MCEGGEVKRWGRKVARAGRETGSNRQVDEVGYRANITILKYLLQTSFESK